MTTSDFNPGFEALLDYIKQNFGYDLRGNKRSYLMRRFQVRMQQLNIENDKNYLEYLQKHPEEFTALLETIFINNSCFFRDCDAWSYLANEIIPKIIASKQFHEQIRIWSAGCAYGQEVYTLAMLLAEAVGWEQYLEQVQIFATDIDDNALKQARRGIYTTFDLAGVPKDLVSKYFEKTEQQYIFRPQLRSSIIFGCHDLAINAPMSKIDLLVCRNVLIYFNRETLARIFVRFHFALADQGFLFLGKAESLVSDRQSFTPISLKYRIFVKGGRLSSKDHLLLKSQTSSKLEINSPTTQESIWQAAFEMNPIAQIALDRNYRLLMANERARTLFGLKNVNLGTKLQDLEVGGVVNLIGFMMQLEILGQPLSLKNIKWVSETDTAYLDIDITPISNPGGRLLGAMLSFIDVTECIFIADNVQRLNSNLTEVTLELRETKKLLHDAIRELESTKKELESLNQEIKFREYS